MRLRLGLKHVFWLLLSLTLGCGSKEQSRDLSSLDVSKLSVTAGFDVAEPDRAQVIASLSYAEVADECPKELPIVAELDGTAFSASPNGSGRLSSGICQVGFYLETTTSTVAERSTISFRDASGQASFEIDHLLAARALISSAEPDLTLSTGDQMRFGWSVESDQLQSADAYFKQGSETIKAEARVAGNNVTVSVPELAAGKWSLEWGAVAAGSVRSCDNAAQCRATIAGNGALAVQVQ